MSLSRPALALSLDWHLEWTFLLNMAIEAGDGGCATRHKVALHLG